ncbi:MAG: hypothetical protein MI740_01765 [Halanaerobiales bacterium]|nr:hypothetical protein [Halanaerobiales bacterium]
MEEILKKLLEGQAGINNRLDSMDHKLDSLGNRMDTVENSLDSVEDKLATVDNRLDSVEDKLATVDNRLDSVEDKLTTVEKRLEPVESKLDSVENRFDSAASKLDSLGSGQKEIYGMLRGWEESKSLFKNLEDKVVTGQAAISGDLKRLERHLKDNDIDIKVLKRAVAGN